MKRSKFTAAALSMIILFSVVSANKSRMVCADEVESDIPIISDIFPDEVFRTYIADSFDCNNDGVLNEGELQAITDIYLIDCNITSLEGIEYFKNLSVLRCDVTPLTSLDLSQNTSLE